MSHDRFDSPDLTRRVLAATSGSACARAENLLAARGDADADPLDLALLEGHFDRCEPCRELAEVLAWARPTLPALAEWSQGRAFTAAVLARTSRRPARGLVPSLERAALAAIAMVQRPRIALEAGWVGAMLAAILIWSPIAPSGMADQAVAAVQSGGAVVPRLVPEVTGKIEQEVDAACQRLRERTSDVVARGHSFWQTIFGVEMNDNTPSVR
jgi:hypothetical protein